MNLSPLLENVSLLSSECDDFEQQFHGLLAELGELHQRLQSDRNDLEAERLRRHESVESESQRANADAERISLLELELAETRCELELLQSEPSAEETKAEIASLEAKFELKLTRALAERDQEIAARAKVEQEITAIKQELETSRVEFEDREVLQKELATHEKQLTDCQQELASNQEAFANASAALAKSQQQCESLEQQLERLIADSQIDSQGESEQGNDNSAELIAQHEQTITKLHRELGELKQERALLEQELERVRGRASELKEEVRELKHEASQYRSETTEELKHLRRLVERQAEMLVEGMEAASRERQAPPAVAPTPVAAADPVVNSVMEQFAKIQQNAANKRKKK